MGEPHQEQYILGWEEWLSLPDIGLPAIKAKIDTGARTSALHASVIEPFGPAERPQVRFLLRPNPADPTLEVTCSARVIDRRNITSSNGERELRYVIATTANMGTRSWPIELTLTNRSAMAYRMLLGRTAIADDMIVDPNSSFAQPPLSYELYKNIPRKRPVKRPLRIALLTREPNNYSSRRLIEAANARDHDICVIDTKRCYMRMGGLSPEVHYNGKALPKFDAVIPRIGASITAYGMAVLRQFASTGALCLNNAEAIGATRDKLLAHQLLSRAKIAVPVTIFANSPKGTKELISLVGNAPLVVKSSEPARGRRVALAKTNKAAESLVDEFRGLDTNFIVQAFIEEAAGTSIRCFVVGNKVVGAMRRQSRAGELRANNHRPGQAMRIQLTNDECAIARRAVRELGLAVGGVDILRSNEGPKVLDVSSSPGLEAIEHTTGLDIATLMIEYLERRVRPLSRVREKK